MIDINPAPVHAIDLHIHANQRTAVAHSGPWKGTRFVRVGCSSWLRAGIASPQERAEAAQAAKSTALPDVLADLLREAA
jgi:hypothetical protein